MSRSPSFQPEVENVLQRENGPNFSQYSAPSSMPLSNSLPITPASSIKGHSRFPSGSTIASSPPVRASMDSYISKRPLAQLREHPEEVETDMLEISPQETSESEQFDGFSSFPPHSRTSSREEPSIDYDWVENLPFDGSDAPISIAKRRRADKATPSVLSNKIASRFPSLSRKFRSRSEKRSSSIVDGMSLHDSFMSRSRASSMRSIGTRESSLDILDRRELSILPTPRTSFIEEEPTELLTEPVEEIPEEDLNNECGVNESEHPGQSRTPLLPPVLVIRSDISEAIQSPLQSPKVAETPAASPSPLVESPNSPGIPSPPLSSRPSIASFHRRAIIPSSEIPPIALESREGPIDAWSLRLGHENFCIQPEPYLPLNPTLESCRQLKADWEFAEREFGRHLARTRANYSATSRIAKLTEEKWTSVNALWIRYHSRTLEAATNAVNEQFAEGSNQSVSCKLELSEESSLHEPVPIAQIPNHLVGGKFPTFGDAGIVGPMEVVKPTMNKIKPISKSRKRGVWRFLQDWIPGSIVSSKA